MGAAEQLENTTLVPEADELVVLHGVPWDAYRLLAESQAEHSGPRMAYLDGVLEIMSPSAGHEGDKTMLARLLETYAVATGLELEGYGSWSLRQKIENAGLEPDECYCVGPLQGEPARPDFAIEVERTRPAVSKLEIYRRLQVPEVWRWTRHRKLVLYALGPDTSSPDGVEESRQGNRTRWSYLQVDRSQFLPLLDMALLAACMEPASQTAAVRLLLAKLDPLPSHERSRQVYLRAPTLGTAKHKVAVSDDFDASVEDFEACR